MEIDPSEHVDYQALRQASQDPTQGDPPRDVSQGGGGLRSGPSLGMGNDNPSWAVQREPLVMTSKILQLSRGNRGKNGAYVGGTDNQQNERNQ